MRSVGGLIARLGQKDKNENKDTLKKAGGLAYASKEHRRVG